MKERNLLDICKCCGQRVETRFCNEDVDYNNLTLKSYKAYKDFEVSICPNCGFVSDNIFADDVPSNIKDIVESEDYLYVLNYEYITEEIGDGPWNYELGAYNPNQFEAYALVLDCLGDFENELKALAKCIDLKQKLVKYMHKKKCEDAEDGGWEQEYEQIEQLLAESIEINADEISELYKDIKSPNKFTQLLYVEALANAGATTEAKHAYKQLENLPQDIADYFKTLIK